MQRSAGRDHLVGCARGDLDIFFSNQPLGLDGRNGVFLQPDPRLKHEDHLGLVILKRDLFDPADFHPGDHDGRAGPQSVAVAEYRLHFVAVGGEEFVAGDADAQESEAEDADRHEQADKKFEALFFHGR